MINQCFSQLDIVFKYFTNFFYTDFGSKKNCKSYFVWHLTLITLNKPVSGFHRESTNSKVLKTMLSKYGYFGGKCTLFIRLILYVLEVLSMINLSFHGGGGVVSILSCFLRIAFTKTTFH